MPATDLTRTELLDLLAARRDHGRTPRIDTIHNRIAAALQIIPIAEQEVDDLHVLAYERHAARSELAVAGGQTDYALDTHGDPQARHAYRQLGLAAIDAVEILGQAAQDTIRILRNGERGRSGRYTINVEELLHALDAQARRALRGEYTPVRREPQPDSDNVINRIRKERDEALRRLRRVEKLARHLAGQLDQQETA